MPRALSAATALVLDALARGNRHGFDILDATGLPSGTVYPILPSGTVYPILRRLEQDGVATSRWESAKDAQAEQRPPRRYYTLTRDGQGLVEDARARFPILGGVPSAARAKRA